MERYSIGVTGQIQGGYERCDVQRRLADLFKCSPEKALSLVSDKPVTLRKGLDRETADRYRQQLLKAGVVPEIKRMLEPEAGAGLATPMRPSPAAGGGGRSPATPVEVGTIPLQTAAAGMPAGMDCPKCGTTQPRAESCARCGIVIAKFRGTPPAEEGMQHFTTPPPSEMEELGAFVGRNFSAYRHKFQDLLESQGKYRFHWHWPAFFIAFPWMLYRKMYLHAFVLVAVGMLPLPVLKLVLPLLCGALGNYLYFRHCRSRLATVQAMDAARQDAVSSAGGTLPLPATILCTLLVGALATYAGFHLFYKDQLRGFPGGLQAAAVSPGDGEAGQNTLGKMMAIGQFLKIYMAAEKMTGKEAPPPMSMGDIQRMFRLDANDASDEWGTELQFTTEGGRSMLLSAGPDGEFSTGDDLTYEVRF